MTIMTRRGFLFRVSGAVGAMTLTGGGNVFSRAAKTQSKEMDVSPAEDLMREHGVLRRILLVYRHWIGRLAMNRIADIETLADSQKIIRSFVEDYHEKLEEDYLFPRLKKEGKLTDTVDELLKQHRAGRTLTDISTRLSNADSLTVSENRAQLSGSLLDFILMYEPHASREDTVVFPAFHQILSEKEYDDLGDAFEKKEHELFGQNGFEKMVDRVAAIEKKLEIYDLSIFTPKG